MPFFTMRLERRPGERSTGRRSCAARPPARPSHVEAGLDAVEERRAVVAAVDVVLAGPDHLDRDLRGLGHLHRLAHEVGGRRRPAAEAAAEEGGVDLDLLGLEAGDLRRRSSGPSVWNCVPVQISQLSPSTLHRAVQRLHRRVGEVGDVVLGLEPSRPPSRARPATSPLSRATAPLRPGLRTRHSARMRLGVERAPRARGPTRSRARPGPAWPPRSGRRPRRRRWAPARPCSTPATAFASAASNELHLAAEDGRARDQGGEQAGELHVHAELRPAGDLLRRVEPPASACR